MGHMQMNMQNTQQMPVNSSSGQNSFPQSINIQQQDFGMSSTYMTLVGIALQRFPFCIMWKDASINVGYTCLQPAHCPDVTN